MMDLDALLNAARQRANLTSDRQLAIALQLTAGAVNDYRKRRALPSEATTLKLADLAGWPREQTLIELQFCKVTSDDVRAAWTAIAQKIAVSVVVATLGLAFTTGQSAANETRTDCSSGAGLYIMTFKELGLWVIAAAAVEATAPPATVAGRWMT